MILRPIYNNLITVIRSLSRKQYKFPELLEADLEEHFVRGWGPGGQKVNKAANCVALKHVPTGLQVKVHTMRELNKNREIARERLTMLLDRHLHGEDCFEAINEDEKREKKHKAKKRNEKRREAKAKRKAETETDCD